MLVALKEKRPETVSLKERVEAFEFELLAEAPPAPSADMSFAVLSDTLLIISAWSDAAQTLLAGLIFPRSAVRVDGFIGCGVAEGHHVAATALTHGLRIEWNEDNGAQK